MAVDLSSDKMVMWKDGVVKDQQEYCDTLGTHIWRVFEESQYIELKREIGFALFGVPQDAPSESLNDGTGYTKKNLNHINTIFESIKKCMQHDKNQKNILASFFFVFGKTRGGDIKVPVIRVHQPDNSSKQNVYFFIDDSARVYKNWQDYLDNNMLPKCVLCYPRNGVYSADQNGVVELDYGISPPGRTAAQVLKGFDIGGTVLNLGAGGTLIAGLFVPIALPIVAAAIGVTVATGVYSGGRSIQTLVDRGQHQQTLGLNSPEARSSWLGIGGSVMSIASGGSVAAATVATRAAATMPLAGQIAIKTVAVGSSVVNGLAVSNGLANIIVKALNKEEITALDVFQFTSAVLFFTHSVISTHLAISAINSMGKNSSGGSPSGIKAFMNRISEVLGPTGNCKNVPGVIFGCSPSLSIIAEGTALSLLSVCSVVGRKLMEITKSLLRGLTNMCNYMLEVERFLGQLWESWNKEITEVVDIICRAFGVKHWSELVIEGCKYIESVLIKEMAGSLIAEKRSLVDCWSRAMPSHQRLAIYDNSAVVGTGYGPNSLVDRETPTVSYYDEITNIHAKFVGRQRCKNPAEFCKYMKLICEFVRSQLQKKKSHHEKTWEMVKNYVTVEDFKKQCGISGNPDNHFLQEVFNEFKDEEEDVFNLLQLTCMKQNAGTSTQEKQHAQGFFDAEGVRFYPFYSVCGMASNGMPSKQQYCEMAAEFMGWHADRNSIYMSASGDAAVIQTNNAADVMIVQCWPEDGKVSGIAAVLCASE